MSAVQTLFVVLLLALSACTVADERTAPLEDVRNEHVPVPTATVATAAESLAYCDKAATLFLANGTSLFRTRDLVTWEPITVPDSAVRPLTSVAAGVRGDRRAILIAARDGIYRSPDGGISWSKCSPEAVGQPNVVCIPQCNCRSAWVGSSTGVWRSPNLGMSWQRFERGIGPMDVRAIAPEPARVDETVAVATQEAVFVTFTEGHLFAELPLWLRVDEREPRAVTCLTVSRQGLETGRGELLVGTPTGVRVTADGGTTWRLVPGLPGAPRCLTTDSRGRVYCATSSGTYVRSDIASGWRQLSPVGAAAMVALGDGVVWVAGDRLFLATGEPIQCKTTPLTLPVVR